MMFDEWIAAAKKRSSKCTMCGKEIGFPGLCSRCAADVDRVEQANQIASWTRDIPLAAREASSESVVRKILSKKDLGAATGLANAIIGKKTRSALIVGHAGAGKTTMAAVIARQLIEFGLRVRWFSAVQIARAAPEAKLGTTPEITERALSARVLVLDDLGMERERLSPNVYDVIHERHEFGRVVIVTSGLTPEQMNDRYGSGLVRRLTERSQIVVVGGKK